MEPKKSFRVVLLEALLSGAAAFLGDAAKGQTLGGGPYTRVLGFLHEQTRVLATFNDPHGIYAYEMIDVR